jgi:hypothetical protein
MTELGGYRDGVALWSAAASRAKIAAKETGVPSHALLRRFVFDRFLARVFHDPNSPWVLKGGTAVLARVHDARTTKDVDLFHEQGSPDAALAALRVAITDVHVDDHFRFIITKVEPSPRGGQPAVDGCRVTVEAYCGAQKKDTFGVDLVTGSMMTASPQIAVDPVLDLRGISGAPMRLYPVVDHIADKLCATQAMYGED